MLSRDVTPDNKDDNFGNGRDAVELTRIQPTKVSGSVHKDRYSYRRLVFDGVLLDELTLAVYADFYYVGDIAYHSENFDIYNDKAYGTLCLYTFADENVEVKLTKEDIAEIENYK